ncbi:beta-ketoacyl-[acyl-carrier-protein] synthase family protein [Nocardia sp. NPDC127579]|uniref:beta-ketoacyl-[acyl-carrier-protein] synthase family protein n=1 Tax=Nocardia sp. NPDC127579 TaxID=3345402 RepID=UPI003635EAF8
MTAHRKSLETPTPAVATIVDDEHARVAHRLYALAPEPNLPASEYAARAAAEAFADAGLTPESVAGRRVCVILASSIADARTAEQARISGQALPISDFGNIEAVRRRIGLPHATGYELGNACAGSGYAISVGCDLLASGQADVVIAGGAESYSRVTVAASSAMAALSPSGVCRPFDRRRDGVVFGEGAAVVVLETADSARARGASSYAAVAGAGWSCDAHHPMASDPAGTQATRSLREALERAGTAPAEVGCVIPHGTGTPHNDVVESRVLAAVFGAAMEQLPIYSVKTAIGHLAGGAGASSVVIAAAGIRDGRLPRNAPIEPDPECPVWLPTSPIELASRPVVINAYGAGGHNISLVLREAE